MAEDCPGCQVLAQVMRRAADTLAGGAGAVVGGALGTQAFLRTGDPSMIARGRVAGAAVAPQLVERGAFAIRDVVKKKRKQTSRQKARSKRMSKAMKKARSKAKLKNGSWRKGWDQSRMMREAHRLCE